MKKILWFLSSLVVVNCFCFSLSSDFSNLQHGVGKICYAEESTTDDNRKIFENCFREAMRGDAEAQFKLGEMYYDGKYVIKNDEKALEWFMKAAEQGHIIAQGFTGYIYYTVQKDYKKAFEWFMKGAKQGDANSQCGLGNMYFNGTTYVHKDDREALKWLEKAAEQGVPEAQLALGYMYQKGFHVNGDYVVDLNKAIELYVKAAEKGNADLKKRANDRIAVINSRMKMKYKDLKRELERESKYR